MGGQAALKQLQDDAMGSALVAEPVDLKPQQGGASGKESKSYALARKLLERRIVELKMFVDMLNSESVRHEVRNGKAVSLVVEAVGYAVDECGISPRTLSEFTQTDPSTISRWVNGKVSPNRWQGSNILDAVCTCLKTKIEELNSRI